MITWSRTDTEWVERILAEYREMPGLCLTLPQAARLWALDIERCRALLDGLVRRGRVRRNTRGQYCLAAAEDDRYPQLIRPRSRVVVA